MEWLIPCKPNYQFEDPTDNLLNFKIREFIPQSNVQKNYSLLTQFFLLLSSQHSTSSMTSLFVDNRVANEIIEEIIMHFDVRRIVLTNDLPSEIMVSKPNQESLSEIRSTQLHPIIKDLFASNSVIPYEWRPSKSYKVLSEFIDRYEDVEFDKVIDCLKNTAEGPIISFSLSSWTIEESLKDTLAIRYFAHKCKNVYLWIDESHVITTIQLELH